MSNLPVVLVLGTLIAVLCTCCNGCDEEVPPPREIVCNETTVVVSKVKGNINKFKDYRKSADRIIGVKNGYFTVNSTEQKIKVTLPNSCQYSTHLYIKASMEPGNFMQANRDRYEGAMCTPRRYNIRNINILFGMKVENSTTSISNFTVGYICHKPNMGPQARLIFRCPKVVPYIMNSSEALKSLAGYLVSNLTQSILIGMQPDRHLCQIFKYVKIDCNLKGFDHIHLENC